MSAVLLLAAEAAMDWPSAAVEIVHTLCSLGALGLIVWIIKEVAS